jgi:flagellar motor switch protein FliN/FliY
MNNDSPIENVPAPSTTGTASASSAASTAPVTGLKAGLLDNVQLDTVLRFGQRQISLREIGALRFGSVVELDKAIQDPAELLVGDKVVARGEVVIVNGNYGLRVTEVVAS